MMLINISRVQYQIIGWSANNEFERLKKAILGQYEVLSQHSPGTNDENYEQPVRKSDLQGKTWTLNFLNTEHECYTTPMFGISSKFDIFFSCEMMNPLQCTLCETILHITGHRLWLTE
jgi:hypothetical protein